MKTLYLDCGMGAAGDMLTAALLELLPDREKVMEELNTLGIPGVEMACEKAQKCGIGGTHVSVQVNGGEESEEMYGGGYTHGAAHVHDHMHTTHETEDDHAHGHTHEAEQIHGHEHATHEAEHSHEHVHEAEHTHGHSHTHHHSGLHEIEHIVSGLSLSERIRKDILAVFGMIAEAESHVHGVPVTDIHFMRWEPWTRWRISRQSAC